MRGGGDGSEEEMLPEEEVNEMRKWLQALNSLDTYITDHIEGNGEATLRGRQFTVFEDIREFLEHGGSEGYVKLPTGVGKTVLFTELVEAMDLRTLIVVPTRLLIGQTEEKIEQFAPDLEAGKVYARAKQYGRQVTIITYQSFVYQLTSGTLKPEDYDCLILDEAHVSLSKNRANAVKQFTHAVKLGFTATPQYSEKKKVSSLLETEIHSMTIREAVEDEGLLSSFSSIVARTDTDLSKVKITSSGEYDETDLGKAVNIQSRNQAAVDLYRQAFDGQLAIAYCVGIKHAEKVAGLFNAEGVPAAVISGGTPEKEQKKIKEKFKNGEIKVLCNADILIAGFDEPRASVCLNLRPTRSRVIAEQRGGRVLRLDEDNEEKHATVVDFIDRGLEKNMPVLFADVADGAQFLRRKKTSPGGRGGRPSPLLIDIEGLEVIVDAEEIMRIVSLSNVESKKQSYLLSLDQLRKEVTEAGITQWQEYVQERKKHKGWPSNLIIHFGEQWPGWTKFLELEKFIPFEKLKQEVIAENIASSADYKSKYKLHKGWPSEPHIVYKEWSGWHEFLDKEKIDFLSLTDLKRGVRKVGVKTYDQYHAERKKHKGWPSYPEKYYKNEWVGWRDLLGTELTFARLQSEVRAANVQSHGEYQEKRNKDFPHWPFNPRNVFIDEWPGWGKFFDREKLAFTDLQKEVRQAGIKGKNHYMKEYKNHKGWPSDPGQRYTDWRGWPSFLGKE